MALKVGALGYLLKDSSPEELVHAIHSVHMGQMAVPAALARAALSAEAPASLPLPTELTERELEVLPRHCWRAIQPGNSRGPLDQHLHGALAYAEHPEQAEHDEPDASGDVCRRNWTGGAAQHLKPNYMVRPV